MRRDNKRRRTFRHKTIPSRLLRHKDTDKRQGPCVTPSLKRAPKMPAPLAYRLAADSRHDGEMTFFLSFRAPVSLIPDGKGMGSFPTAGRSPRFTPPLISMQQTAHHREKNISDPRFHRQIIQVGAENEDNPPAHKKTFHIPIFETDFYNPKIVATLHRECPATVSHVHTPTPCP